MGELNISRRESEALKAIDAQELRRAIADAIDNEHGSGLDRFPIWQCPLFVSRELGYFRKYLASYAAARSGAKRASTKSEAERAGDELFYCLRDMQERLAEQEREGQLFHVDDNVLEPSFLTRNLAVTIHYRWRPSMDDEWTRGSISFSHYHDPAPVYIEPWLRNTSKRKPSAAKQQEKLQEELFRAWEHLRNDALYTMRDYLRDNREAINVPEKFPAKTDGDGRISSLKFWS